jgi:hypothetical protein
MIVCRTSELSAARDARREPEEAILDEEALIVYVGERYQRPVAAWHVDMARISDDCETLAERVSGGR